MRELTTYDDIDQTNPAEKIQAAAPAFFVDTMKKYIARNSIKTTAPEFAFYCACTWDEQKHWLSEENINWAIRWIVSELPYPRLPADADWYKPRQEWENMKREELYQKELEQRRKLLSAPRPKPTPEQIASVEKLVASVCNNLKA